MDSITQRIDFQPAFALIMLGLGIQMFSFFHWTPFTFLTFMGVGVPISLVGSALFLWKVLKRKKE